MLNWNLQIQGIFFVLEYIIHSLFVYLEEYYYLKRKNDKINILVALLRILV